MEHETKKLAIYLTNLGKYNEGALVGEWITLPIDAEKMQAVFQRIGLGEEYEGYFITDYENSLGIKMEEYEDLDKLNYLANKLNGMYPYELEKYEAILAIDSTTAIADYINLTENMDCYYVISNVDSKSDLGQFVMDELNSEILEQMGDFASYFDFEQYGMTST
ncbi:antirestriction protein ArdA [Listeria booriae]|uniref:antirestriction protein ArdA n=1 Tax=Listeria booriae TaxID=1552123 RepID=UPI001623318E|nr:antirestriction protein ArdA [Listeria booriae]MBC2319212.1 antirestriction protein ArdA [Listeria booriae]